MKILIEVKGGNVQTVLASSQECQIVIVDHDNIDAGDEPVGDILSPDAVYENMYEAYTDEKDARDMEIRDQLKSLNF